MSKFEISIDFTDVDLDQLDTEEDFRDCAKLLLPSALIKLGEAVAEKTWDDLQIKLKAQGIKVSSSQSEKRKFIQETVRNYKKNASNRERQELEDYIVEELRKQQ
jgi:hypothetical protein